MAGRAHSQTHSLPWAAAWPLAALQRIADATGVSIILIYPHPVGYQHAGELELLPKAKAARP